MDRVISIFNRFPQPLLALLVLLVVAFLLTGAGCSVVGKPAAEKVADVVSEYCAREPLPARKLYRTTINAELAEEGHSVAVHCSGDPEEE